MRKRIWGLVMTAGAAIGSIQCTAADQPKVSAPGSAFDPPQRKTSRKAPKVFEYNRDAGPDQTFFLVGEDLTENVVAWGMSDSSPKGQEWKPQVQFCNGQYMAVTLPQAAYDGVFVLWVGSDRGWSEPFVLNSPQAWWAHPDKAAAGQEITIYGRNLARRPDFDRSFVYAARQGSDEGEWLKVVECGKYRVKARLPEKLPAGPYRLWVHTGVGGDYGWSSPPALHVDAPAVDPKVFDPDGATAAGLREAVAAAGEAGGGVVQLPAGAFDLDAALKVPAGVFIRGAGRGKTVLRFAGGDESRFAVRIGKEWNHFPQGPHQHADHLYYTLDVPRTGEWTVWVHYARDASRSKQAGTGAESTLTLGRGDPVPLGPLPDSGGWGRFRWARAAKMQMKQG
ncbi:MAG TPA: hypothetical protein VM389_13695, partial [Phycisphaerae bacterium]|nr:hypothetical protein [Phycisphaerae bacterium]